MNEVGCGVFENDHILTPGFRRGLAVLIGLSLGSSALALPGPPHDLATGITCSDCHVPYGGLSGATDSTATAGTDLSLTDGTMAWGVDAWVGGVVSFAAGPNSGEFRAITSSTATTVTWALPLPSPVTASDPYSMSLATEADVEILCKTCHNPLGMAASMSDVGGHRITGFGQIGCGKCHEPHNLDASSGVGNALIREDIRWPSANNPTIFPQPTGSEFVRESAPYDGICETCHTSTIYHRNDENADHSHESGEACTDCHQHGEDFTLDCLDCHILPRDNGDGVPVGGRRAAAAEYPADLSHAHSGGLLDEADCVVCHEMSSHRQGVVRLSNPDDGTVLAFETVADITGDPDISDFCMACHDDDGAARLATPLDPFGNGNVPPEVASRFQGTLQWDEWYGDYCFGSEGTLRGVNSHHDISDADQAFSGAQIECLSCHGAHSVNRANAKSDPWGTEVPYAGTTNEFCNECHNGGTDAGNPGFPLGVTGPDTALRPMDSCNYGMSPWYVDYTWPNLPHGGDSKRGWAGYSGAPEYELDCTDCHDPHGSFTPTNTEGNPYMIRDFVDGTAYVDDGARTAGFNGPPFNTYGVARAVEVQISGNTVVWSGPTGLCDTCHVDWEAAMWSHDMCSACQTCHGHGQAWGAEDFGAGGQANTCP